jgi:hypothetical protein
MKPNNASTDRMQIEDGIDALNRRALARRNKAKDRVVKGLRPTATDWMTTEELERYQDLQAALIPHTRQDRADAQERVRLKRAARLACESGNTTTEPCAECGFIVEAGNGSPA